MIITWCCQQCGWANDNNNGACRRCGGDENANGRIKVKADNAKIAVFDGLLRARLGVSDGGKYDRR